jgi:hypothetical protein
VARSTRDLLARLLLVIDARGRKQHRPEAVSTQHLTLASDPLAQRGGVAGISQFNTHQQPPWLKRP